MRDLGGLKKRKEDFGNESMPVWWRLRVVDPYSKNLSRTLE